MIEPPHRIKGRRPYLNDDLLDVAIPTLVAQRDDITFGVNCRIISTCLTRPYRPKAYWFIQSITIHPGQTKHKQKYEPHSKPGTNERLYLPILCQETIGPRSDYFQFDQLTSVLVQVRLRGLVPHEARLDLFIPNPRPITREAYLAESKRKNRSKKHAEERMSEFSLTIDDTERRKSATQASGTTRHLDKQLERELQTDSKETNEDNITWSSRRYTKLELFPYMLGSNPNRPPTSGEFDECRKLINGFKLFNYGKVVIHDKKDRAKIIAVMEFTPFEELTPSDFANINYVTRFLHSAKQFVNAVGSESRSWGGKMFAIGWRKAMVGFQLIGLYRNKAAVDRSPQAYNSLMKRSERASSILGKLF
ncbi:hypothetical protein PGT21_014284 [Puccinia graminis f. sp. tritici]|uniref:Tet-like 2OG-Fe(II) oxygenase domain-containing protein n=1 Tax=Puccinia graminis f. sp. tritici TaxID=56615 RepID=A0A5B0LXD4_PUCGR|nr:hypothetical protein PGT21_014284 [Puccinia graminis f. sp. tritici]